MDKICESCGNSFSVPPVRATTAHYCSRQCYWTAKTGAVDFWSRVSKGTPSECWLWQGAVGADGYGNLRHARKWYRAHRRAWEMTFGDIIEPEGITLVVMHKCDTPLCCNPAHLRLDTHQANVQDMLDKGRQLKHQPLLRRFTPDEIRDIRKAYAEGESMSSIRRRLRMGGRTIDYILHGITYTDVT